VICVWSKSCNNFGTLAKWSYVPSLSFMQGRPTAGEPSNILQCFIPRRGESEMHGSLPRRSETCAHFSRGELQHGWISPREKLDTRVCLMFPRGKSTPVPFLPGITPPLLDFSRGAIRACETSPRENSQMSECSVAVGRICWDCVLFCFVFYWALLYCIVSQPHVVLFCVVVNVSFSVLQNAV
jgi:hypothetical protein